MTLKPSVCVLDFVPYERVSKLGASHEIKREELTVPQSYLPALETLQQFGVTMRYDGATSQGILILSRSGQELGTVRKWGNAKWLLELLQDLEALAENPSHHGLKA